MSEQTDRQEDAAYYVALYDALMCARQELVQEATEYRVFCDARNGLIGDAASDALVQETCHLLEKAIHEAPFLTTEIQRLPITKYEQAVTRLLCHYRACLRQFALAKSACSWVAASCDQSTVATFSSPKDQSMEGVRYTRYEQRDRDRWEHRVHDVLGFGKETALLATTSGMGAYALLEAYLVRQVLRPGDCVYAPRYMYFEAEEQLRGLSAYRWVREDHHEVYKIAQRIEEMNPRVVFVDALTNTRDTRLLSLQSLIDLLVHTSVQDLTIVTDATTLLERVAHETRTASGGVIRVLFYGSGSKYLPLGMDMTLAGWVGVPEQIASHIRLIRRNTGLALSEACVWQSPLFSRDVYEWRMKRLTRNAQRFCETYRAQETNMKVCFPGDTQHPDQKNARRHSFLGGLVTFRCEDADLQQVSGMNAYIDRLLTRSRAHRIPLTKGVSFGMSIPRISASLAMAGTESAFLRLSIGDRTGETVDRLAEVMRQESRACVIPSRPGQYCVQRTVLPDDIKDQHPQSVRV